MNEELVNNNETDPAIDALINEASQTPATPDTIQEAPVENANPAAAQAAKPTYPEVEFTWNGKPVKASWDKAKLWAQQGYNYSQQQAAFKKQQAAWEASVKEKEAKFNPYMEVDELAKKHPEQWAFIQKQLQNLKQNPQSFGQEQPNAANDAIRAQILDAIEKRLAPIEDHYKSSTQRDQELTQKTHDDQLDSEIQSIREKYPTLDWDTYDENGMNLEKRVIDHAIKNGISNFRAAFRDYNYDSLTKFEADRAKEMMAKETQKRTKLGLLGTSSTPKANSQGTIKPKDYNEAASMAMEELGIA